MAKSAGHAGVAKVIGISKLKANYHSYEEKRRLAASYDLFAADARIIPILPKLLGKSFFKKKKQPIPVDLTKGDWGAQIRRATDATCALAAPEQGRVRLAAPRRATAAAGMILRSRYSIAERNLMAESKGLSRTPQAATPSRAAPTLPPKKP